MDEKARERGGKIRQEVLPAFGIRQEASSAKAETTPGAPSKEEIQEIDKLAEEGKLKPEKGLVPISPGLKTAIWVAAGLGSTGCTGSLIGQLERLIHPPAIVEPVSAREEPVPEVSQPQAEAPKIVVSSEAVPGYFETAPEYIRKEPKIVTHIVEKGESLTTLGEKYGLPWQMIYVKNLNLIGNNPSLIHSDKELIIPTSEEVEFVNQQLSQEGLNLETINCEEPSYFPETGHYVRPPYLEFFRRHGGQEITGAPISEPVGSGAQFFEKMALIQTGEDKVEFMNIGDITVYILKDKIPPKSGDFSLDERFAQFYQSHGGEEVFGYPITGLLEENGRLVQYTQNARLEWNEAIGQVEIGNLGKEFAEGWKERQKNYGWEEIDVENVFEYQPGMVRCVFSLEDQKVLFRARRALEEYSITHPELINQPLIEQLRRENPEKLDEIFTRAQAVMAIVDAGFPQAYPENFTEEAARDWRIFKYHWGGDSENPPIPTYEQVLGALLKHYLDYESNPLVERALSEMPKVARTINKIIESKAEPDWFVDEKIPLIPENWEGIFVFPGEPHTLGGGLSYFYPVLFGAYNEYKTPDDYKLVLDALAVCGAHELIHARIQVWSVFPFPLNFSEDRGWRLAHMAMSVLTAGGQEAVGLEPTIEPRIIYIYSVLKRARIPDPYKEIVRAAVTENSDKLWDLYESVRKPEYLSLDELLRTINPDSDFFYYSPEELEAFRAEYFPYLGK